MHRYRAAGLEIESDLELPGLIASQAPAEGLQLTMRVGETPAALDGALETGPNWQRAAGAFLLTIPGVARFLVRDGRELVACPESETAPDDLAIFLAGPLLGICLHLRGATPLLASAVRVGDRAVLFCGESGAGKSTLAAALGKRGHRMIADDLCALDLAAAGGVAVLPDAATLKLWALAVRRLELEAGPPVRVALQKLHVDPPAGLAPAAPVAAIYVLREARKPHTPGIQRPNVTDTAILVRRSAYRPNLVRALGQRSDYFMAAARLANAGGLFTWDRELGFDRMEAQVDQLEAHWAEIGLVADKVA